MHCRGALSMNRFALASTLTLLATLSNRLFLVCRRNSNRLIMARIHLCAEILSSYRKRGDVLERQNSARQYGLCLNFKNQQFHTVKAIIFQTVSRNPRGSLRAVSALRDFQVLIEH